MIARLHSVAFCGIEAQPIEIEVDVSPHGFAKESIVGLPDAAVKESMERVRSAIQSSGYQFPRYKTVVNLAPADLRKEGPLFDLPTAVGILIASGEVAIENVERYVVAGELALDGRVRSIRGALSAAILAKEKGFAGVVVPQANAAEAAVVGDVEVIPVASLTETIGFFAGELPIAPATCDIEGAFARASNYEVDFSEVRGQEGVKRALIIAAAGGHNMIMVGPPGSGKTMIAKRLPTILPPLALIESLETTRIHSVSGELKPGVSLLGTRPVRSPHHSASTPALVGGGSIPSAGEVSLAHHGVLFLDEFPEFSRPALEALRQPLEDGVVTIARAHHTATFPASFMLVAAMNPCPCGYLTDSRKPCKCAPPQVERYLSRVSGPLVDRIDIHVEVSAVPFSELRTAREGTPSAEMRAKVLAARERQRRRFDGDPRMTNARMGPRQLRACCRLDDAGELALRQAMTELGLSARAHDKVLRVARTIADLDEADAILGEHVQEAIQYRRLDRRL